MTPVGADRPGPRASMPVPLHLAITFDEGRSGLGRSGHTKGDTNDYR